MIDRYVSRCFVASGSQRKTGGVGSGRDLRPYGLPVAARVGLILVPYVYATMSIPDGASWLT